MGISAADSDASAGAVISGCQRPLRKETAMIALGVILLIVGFVLHIGILWTIGIVLLAIGLILFVLGSVGHAVGGRRHYW
jgi:fatty acid desaturase